MFKIAVTGKGGVGKTTLTALLCRSYREAGYRICAVDADPDANLAATLGFPDSEKIIPLSEMKDLIAERTGTGSGTDGVFYKLNPRVDDIPERFGIDRDGIRLLVMGRVKKAGSGCYCPESAFIKGLIGHLLLEEKDVVILDMEAGIEHLGRGTAGDVDFFIVVVEPSGRSVETAGKILAMASDLGVGKCFIIGNKIRNDDDRDFLTERFSDETIIGMIPFSEVVVQSGKADEGVRVDTMNDIDRIRDTLINGVIHGRE